MLKRFIPLLIFIGLVAFLAIGLSLDPKKVPSPLINKPAPALNLPQLFNESELVTNSDMLGEVWLLNVWASWCAACRAEHQVLNAFSNNHHVPLIGLNYKDSRANAKQWLSELGNPYQKIAFDMDGIAGINWGVYGVPETFVIDQQGVIRYKQIGPLNDEILEKTIIPLINKLQKASS
jgi:cytochrome c biogenesis protein CcmG/thiol:disulfide interchange protein DsbE